jgi:glycosyltransferase involved in cell wall biosynthesis
MSPSSPHKIPADRPDDGPSVSVVIPLYNHEEYIESALNSVLSQTVPPSEIIVIDDGSVDGSADIVARLCRDHPQIIFWSWSNQGAHHTLNAGISRATGDFVALLNSDDCYEPDRLAACLTAVRNDPTIDVVATEASFLDAKGCVMSNPWYDDALAVYRQEQDLAVALFHANFLVTTSNVFIRRSVFDAIGNFAPLRYTHDLDFFLRLVLAKRSFHFIDRALVAYRLHASNTISENKTREDVERAAVFALFLYRQCQGEPNKGTWKATLDRYIRVLGRQDMLEMVEGFLNLLDKERPAQKSAVLTESLSSEMLGFMSRLGVDWVTRGNSDSLLNRFASARKVFQRRSEKAGSEALLKADVQWLREQRQAWEHSATTHEATAKALTLALQELQGANAWLSEQRNSWERTAQTQESRGKSLARELEEVQGANVWLSEQRNSWERTAQTQESHAKSLARELEKMQGANAWLSDQRRAWEHTASTQEQHAKSLARALADMQSANAWLVEQSQNWEQAAKSHEENAKSLNLALEEMRSANAWLLDQRDAWEHKATLTGEELVKCESALHGLLSSWWFRLLLRIRVFKLTHIPDGGRNH